MTMLDPYSRHIEHEEYMILSIKNHDQQCVGCMLLVYVVNMPRQMDDDVKS